MDDLTVRERVLYVIRRLREKDQLLAVFVMEKVKVCDAQGRRFALMMQDYPHRLAGVYNKHATLEMIEEDLACFKVFEYAKP
jgi:hypothetical protein